MVSGALANKYLNGGEAWVRLSWILGLRRLGFDVHFVERIAPATCTGADRMVAEFENSVQRDYFERIVKKFGLEESATLVYGDGEKTSGLPYGELLDVAEESELLVNISGHLDLEPLMARLRRKAYVDLDPGFTQFWHANETFGPRLAGHDRYFTVGENVGTSRCSIPTGGLAWRSIRPPVTLEDWPVTERSEACRFTTVATWRSSYGPVEYGARRFGLKVHEFRKVIDLPGRTPFEFEIALDIHPNDARDRESLESHGWRIVDPGVAVPDPDAFRQYVRGSDAEFSVAQGIYVDTASGWFSDRTVRYLASGKPALVQDTGFSSNYPVGEGLLAFRTIEEAVAGAELIRRDYETHSRAARALAEEYFDSKSVLGGFLADLDVAP
jgi:hypothetical protein